MTGTLDAVAAASETAVAPRRPRTLEEIEELWEPQRGAAVAAQVSP
jgi:hypothetical protein